MKLIKLIIKFLENIEFQSINEQKNQLKFKYKFLKFIINSVHYSVKYMKKEYINRIHRNSRINKNMYNKIHSIN